MDTSQLAALRRMLTKRLAVVQGPPGTGKTYVSVQAIRVMLANHEPNDPPIIIACQTNHAIDQILRHIAQFEPKFARLGGRSKDRDVIKARTLYELRNETSENSLAGCLSNGAKKKMAELIKDVRMLLSPLEPQKSPMDVKMLQEWKLLTETQAKSLQEGALKWVQDQSSNLHEARSPFLVWLGGALISVPPKAVPEDFGFDFEEADLEFEQLREVEAENVARDDEDFEILTGKTHEIADNFTCRRVTGMTESKVKDALKQQDMWKIPEATRPAIYRYLQTEAKKLILVGLREKTKAFNEQARLRRIGGWEKDENILKKQKIIGMTTTGFSKYRGLLAALEPKIVLIEEAAETLEAPVTVACLPSLQHLILVGDHQQLRPHTHVKAHEDKPFYLNISLFERLVKNDIEYNMLTKQRRMIPEIRRILSPIYGDLIKDHASVLDPIKRPNVAGMGGINSFFFTHQWGEHRDEQMSAYNPYEADMVVAFVEYLVYNGTQPEDITVLTFYNGQRKQMLRQLRNKVTLGGRCPVVVTVDSYQGEENEVVILSLVRSNDKGQIGFLNIENRVCVALSRAKCGFYIFGNGMLLYNHSIWERVIQIIANKGPKKDRLKTEPFCRLDEKLPIRCSNHNKQTFISSASQFENLVGGCDLKCGEQLACGHSCSLLCHPFLHEFLPCKETCGRYLSCGHPCDQLCGEVCQCKRCNEVKEQEMLSQITNRQSGAFDGKETLSHTRESSSDSWKAYAETEHKRYAQAASAPLSRRASPEKVEDGFVLLKLDGDHSPIKDFSQMRFGGDGVAPEADKDRPAVLVTEKLVGKDKRIQRKEKWVSSVVEVKADKKEDWSQKDSLLD